MDQCYSLYKKALGFSVFQKLPTCKKNYKDNILVWNHFILFQILHQKELRINAKEFGDSLSFAGQQCQGDAYYIAWITYILYFIHMLFRDLKFKGQSSHSDFIPMLNRTLNDFQLRFESPAFLLTMDHDFMKPLPLVDTFWIYLLIQLCLVFVSYDSKRDIIHWIKSQGRICLPMTFVFFIKYF